MITSKEYELLKEYRRLGYKWIARDKNGRLFVYQEIPRKYRKTWNFGGVVVNFRGEYLTFIKWEDEKPTKIEDLINDYEAHQIITSEKVKAKVPQYVADWIEEVKGLKRNFKLEYLFDTTEMPDDVFDWLDERHGDTDILAKAWMDGFEIEKEKLYTVRLANGDCLCRFGKGETDWTKEYSNYVHDPDYHLTQSEIESVDPILMQIAKPVGK